MRVRESGFIYRYELIGSFDRLEKHIFPKRCDVDGIEHENVLAVSTPV